MLAALAALAAAVATAGRTGRRAPDGSSSLTPLLVAHIAVFIVVLVQLFLSET